jgi:hypothetical protein
LARRLTSISRSDVKCVSSSSFCEIASESAWSCPSSSLCSLRRTWRWRSRFTSWRRSYEGNISISRYWWKTSIVEILFFHIHKIVSIVCSNLSRGILVRQSGNSVLLLKRRR